MPSVDKLYTNRGSAADPGQSGKRVNGGSSQDPVGQSGKHVNSGSPVDVGQSGKRVSSGFTPDPGQSGKQVNSGSTPDPGQSGKQVNSGSTVDPGQSGRPAGSGGRAPDPVPLGKRFVSHDEADTPLPPPPPELCRDLPVVPQRSTSLLASLSSSASTSCLGDGCSNFPPFPPPPPPLSSQEICAMSSSQSLHRRPCRLPPYPRKELSVAKKKGSGKRDGADCSGTWPNKKAPKPAKSTDPACRPSDDSTLRSSSGVDVQPSATRTMDRKQETFGKQAAYPGIQNHAGSRAGCLTMGRKIPCAGIESTLYVNGTDSANPKTPADDCRFGHKLEKPAPVSDNASSGASQQGESGSERAADSVVDCAPQGSLSMDCEAYINQHNVYHGHRCDLTGQNRPTTGDTLYTNEDVASCPSSKTSAKPDANHSGKRTLPKDNIRRELEACLNKRAGTTGGSKAQPTSTVTDQSTRGSLGTGSNVATVVSPGGRGPLISPRGVSAQFTPYINSQESASLCGSTGEQAADASPDRHKQSAPYLNAEEAACLSGGEGGEFVGGFAEMACHSSSIPGDFPYVNKDSAPYLSNPLHPAPSSACGSNAETTNRVIPTFRELQQSQECSADFSSRPNKDASATYVNDTTEMCATLKREVSAPPGVLAKADSTTLMKQGREAAVAECRGQPWEGWRSPGCAEGCGGSGGGVQTEQQHLLDGMDSPSSSCCNKQGDCCQDAASHHHPLNRQRSTFSTRSTSSRRRQNDSPCTTCLRGTLHCYNVCILVVGCAVLGVGVWLLVTDFGARNVTTIVGNQMYEVTTYLLIAGGGAVALLAFCGCCGTIREDKCVLSFYGTTLAIVLIVLGVACGLAVFFRGTISEKIKNRMKNSLTMHYGVDVRTNLENRRITESWDALQRQLQCCGIAGNATSRDSWNYFSSSTEWNIREQKKKETKRVPESCCAKGDMQLCTGLKLFNGPPMFYDSHLAKYREVNPYLYTTGCYDKLIEYLHTYSAVVSIVAAVVPLFLILGIVVSFCLCARVAGLSSDDEMDV
ncbi:uncharacterized protein LOC143295352 [Babylonia areolata]|uniref:uncharacterized protein LOC143295352 n=1 Tax=Babylonia areolata TaxID=304850 RepID=UPI003FD0341F